MVLRDLPPLLREEPGFASVLGRSSAVLAVPEPARALAIAGLATPELPPPDRGGGAHHRRRRPPGQRPAGLPRAPTRSTPFPAWETLPFERVSPSVETMGRRLRTLWRLRDPERAPRVLVAPVRALVQRLGPHVGDVEPLVVAPGEQRDRDELVADLVSAPATAARSRSSTGASSPCGARSSTCSRPPPTARCASTCGATRSTGSPSSPSPTSAPPTTSSASRSSGAASCSPPTRCGRGPSKLVALEPWGREQWERLAEGLVFDGMESWLPWLTEDEQVLFDLLGRRRARCCSSSPAACATGPPTSSPRRPTSPPRLAKTWGAVGADGDEDFPRLHLPFDRLLAHTDGAGVDGHHRARGARRRHRARRWASPPPAGDPERVVRQLADLPGRRLPDRRRRRRRGLGRPPRASCSPQPRRRAPRSTSRRSSGAASSRPSSSPCSPSPTSPAGAAPTARPAPGAATRRASSTTSRPGDHVVHHQHGVARYGGMVKRAIGGVERDYLLLEYQGDDKLYVPSDQIDAVRHYTGGESPTLNRLGGDDWQKAKAKVRSAVTEIAQELVVLYQNRLRTPGHAFPQDTPWQRELEDAFPYQETPDQLKAIDDVKADMEAEHPMDRLVCGDVGLRQDRGRHPGRVQGGAGRQAGGGARAHHAARPAALPDLRRPLRRLPGPGRGAVPLPHPGPGPAGGRGRARRARSTS